MSKWAGDQEPAARKALASRGLLVEMGAALLLLALAVLFFWRLLTPNPLDRAHLAWGDLGAQYYPLRLFVARELAQDRLPLWNPYINGGQPALADAQSAVFYPPAALLALAAPGGELTIDSLERYVVGHFVLAGLFTYLFARYALRRRDGAVARLGALAAAVSFTFGGYLTSFPVQQLTILEAGVWLPLLLLLLDIAGERRSPLLFALAGLPLACSWLAGHAQTTMYVVYTAIAYLIVKCVLGSPRRARLATLAGGLFTLALGTALAAAQLLPTYELLRLSTRVDLAYRDTSFGLPLPELFGLLLPGVFGGRTLYVGVLTLALAVLAVAHGRRTPPVRFWSGTAIVAILISLGGNTFLYSFLYLLVPGFAAVRNQERAAFVASFALCLLAAHGLASLVTASEPRLAAALAALRRLLLWSALAALALGLAALYSRAGAPEPPEPLAAIARQAMLAALFLLLVAGILWLREKAELSPGAIAALALALIVLDLFTLGWQANLVEPVKARPYDSNTVTEALAALPDGTSRWRLSSEGLLPGGGSGAVVYRQRDIVGNTPFQLNAYAETHAALDEVQRSRLLAVGYWLTRRDLDSDGRFAKVGQYGDARLYKLQDAVRLARAHVVHSLAIVPDSAVSRRVAAADLSQTAVLAESIAIRHGIAPLNGPAGQVRPPRFLVDTPTRQVLAVELETPGVLVLSEVYYPGWQVFVDGEEGVLLPVQSVLRGVVLPAGQHEVEFRFVPRSLEQGVIISLAALAILGLAVLRGAFRRLAGMFRRGTVAA